MRKTIFTLTTAGLALAGTSSPGLLPATWQPGGQRRSAQSQRHRDRQSDGLPRPGRRELTATAIGMVKGERRSIPLEVTKLSEPGLFAISQQWPKEGKWVIQLVGRNDEQFTNTLVSAGRTASTVTTPNPT